MRSDVVYGEGGYLPGIPNGPEVPTHDLDGEPIGAANIVSWEAVEDPEPESPEIPPAIQAFVDGLPQELRDQIRAALG